MTVAVTVPITQEPLTILEVKQHLRIDFPDDDALLEALIAQAREYGEQETRRSFAPQTLMAMLEIPLLPAGILSGPIGYRQSKIEIPMPPVTSVISLEGETSPGVFQIIDPANYVVDLTQHPCIVYLLTSAYSFLGSAWSLWIGPYNPRFRATYQAGYTQLPFMLKRSLLELIAYWYDYREGRDESGRNQIGLPEGIQSKFDKYRVYYG